MADVHGSKKVYVTIVYDSLKSASIIVSLFPKPTVGTRHRKKDPSGSLHVTIEAIRGPTVLTARSKRLQGMMDSGEIL